MGTATMADKKLRGGRKPAAKPVELTGKEETTTRLYAADAAKLRKLAILKGLSNAETFRLVFGDLLDHELIAAAEREVSDLRKNQTR